MKQATILLLCDGGGSNNARHYMFKADLQQLADEIGIEIRIAHYPPYTSKYNPIEHRLFPHITRACQGVLFESISLVKKLMERTRTPPGLKVTVQIIDRVYQTGRKVADEFKQNMPIKAVQGLILLIPLTSKIEALMLFSLFPVINFLF